MASPPEYGRVENKCNYQIIEDFELDWGAIRWTLCTNAIFMLISSLLGILLWFNVQKPKTEYQQVHVHDSN